MLPGRARLFDVTQTQHDQPQGADLARLHKQIEISQRPKLWPRIATGRKQQARTLQRDQLDSRRGAAVQDGAQFGRQQVVAPPICDGFSRQPAHDIIRRGDFLSMLCQQKMNAVPDCFLQDDGPLREGERPICIGRAAGWGWRGRRLVRDAQPMHQQADGISARDGGLVHSYFNAFSGSRVAARKAGKTPESRPTSVAKRIAKGMSHTGV